MHELSDALQTLTGNLMPEDQMIEELGCILPHDLSSIVTLKGAGKRERRELKVFIDVQLVNNDTQMSMHSGKYINRILRQYNVRDCKPVSVPLEPGIDRLLSSDDNDTGVIRDPEFNYRTLMGAFNFSAYVTRIDRKYCVSRLSQYSTSPRPIQFEAARSLLRYLAGTKTHAITLTRKNQLELQANSDAIYASESSSKQSRPGVLLLVIGAPILWQSKKQSLIALLSAEAKFAAASTATQDITFVYQLLCELSEQLPLPMTLFMYNQACIRQLKKITTVAKNRHVDIRLKYLRSKNNELITAVYKPTKEIAADVFTHATSPMKFKRHMGKINFVRDTLIHLMSLIHQITSQHLMTPLIMV